MAIAADLGLVPIAPRAPDENAPLVDSAMIIAMFNDQKLKRVWSLLTACPASRCQRRLRQGDVAAHA
jgi:hypothetical protein